MAVMASMRQRYRDISPVTLQVVGGAVSSSLYCGEVEGLSGGLVESFLVELFRCKLCQFTCGLKASISGHLQLRHRPPTLTYLGGPEAGGGAEDREEAGLRQGASPYQLDLNGEPKPVDEDEDFLLYNMLDSMSPPTCDIGSEGGLQVAHTCEVSTLFEEDSSIFPLKGGAVDLSCPINPPATQEEMAQSAHLMTLGLCRISASKPPPSSLPPPPPPPSASRPAPPPPDDGLLLLRPDSLKQSEVAGQTRTPPSSGRRLSCLLCPLTLASRQLLDVHVRSHRAGGGFGCVRCRRTADSWEELEPHWRGHGRRRRRRRRRRREEEQQQKQEKMKKRKVAAVRRPFTCPVCLKMFSSAAAQNTHQETHDGCTPSDAWGARLIGRAGGKEADRTDRKFSSKLTLRRHLGVHGGDKPFTCPHCSYSSRLKASLLQHLRTHTGEKPYRCAECPYASIDRSSLLRHSRTHSQEKPYRCQHCDYSSIQKKSLDLHARRHHTGEAFPCQQCEYSSPDRQLLLRHVRRHHLPSQ
ncbi:zinc finger protein 260 isoform X2 [Pempheris klunzingeri]|uniref:zinc finger protein 260 isoform X2 n=1 Tax=Pempheris klunzingeri TaxID=3127111 RepID=UPI00397FF138